MLLEGGYQIARYAQIPWEDRKNVDGWPRRAGMYCNDEANSLCMRLIDYPKGSTEPRHVHAGSHATTVLKGTTIVDGLTLGPLDVILGPTDPVDRRRNRHRDENPCRSRRRQAAAASAEGAEGCGDR